MVRSTTLFLRLLRSDVMRGRKWAIKWPKQLTPSFVYLTRGPFASRRLLLSTWTQKTSVRPSQDLPKDIKLIKNRIEMKRIMFTEDPSFVDAKGGFPLNGSTFWRDLSISEKWKRFGCHEFFVRFSVSLMADPILGNAVSFCVWTWLPSFFKGAVRPDFSLILPPLSSRADTCPFCQKKRWPIRFLFYFFCYKLHIPAM